MALLYRFSKLNDRHNTGIFTFIVTRSVTRDLHRDATTKDFYYGYHRWAVSFTRAPNDKALGVFLILRNASPSTECYADFTLTLLNREHFSRNEQHTEKQAKFTADRTTQGINKWILISEIQSRKFSDEHGEFLLELSLGNILTIFETNLQVSSGGPPKSGKFESASFSFGSFDWNMSLVVHNYGPGASSSGNENNNSDSSGRITYVFLNRLSGFDHPCRAQYRVIIGDGKNQEDSNLLDQISDVGGRIRGFQMQHSLTDMLKPNGTLRVYVELHCCNAISEAKVPITRAPTLDATAPINMYDRSKQGWCIEADMESEVLRLKLFFVDLHSVPRNHLRYISWIAYVIARDPRNGIRESIAVANWPHSNYYVQDGCDTGVMMNTNLPVVKIKESPKVYLEDNKLIVHVEWCDSLMLYKHFYDKWDDMMRIHCAQMRREINALTNENLSLEKQLISYQKSIGTSNDRKSKENGSESGSVGRSNHQIGQRSASEMHLNESGTNRETLNSSIDQQYVTQQPRETGTVNLASGQTSGPVGAMHFNVEKRSAGSAGSGSMLGLPSHTNSNPLSPLHSPLNSGSRNHAQSFHQLSRYRSEYHHQLPAIPIPQQTSHHSSLMQGNSCQNSPQMKMRATHYGSLPINSYELYDEDVFTAENNLASTLTPPRVARNMHRSRERMLGNIGQPAANFQPTHMGPNFGSNNAMANNFALNMPMQQYQTVPYAQVPLTAASIPNAPLLSQQFATNGLSGNVSTNKLASSGMNFYESLGQ